MLVGDINKNNYIIINTMLYTVDSVVLTRIKYNRHVVTVG